MAYLEATTRADVICRFNDKNRYNFTNNDNASGLHIGSRHDIEQEIFISGLGAELGEQGCGGGLGVEQVGVGESGAAELGDAVAHLVEFFGGVSVGVDRDPAAVLFGEAEVEIVEVGSCR